MGRGSRSRDRRRRERSPPRRRRSRSRRSPSRRNKGRKEDHRRSPPQNGGGRDRRRREGDGHDGVGGEPTPRPMSQGSASNSDTVREELARRWADIHQAKRGDSSRLLLQSIQTRANIMQRKAQMNLTSNTSGLTKPLGLGAGASGRTGSALAASHEAAAAERVGRAERSEPKASAAAERPAETSSAAAAAAATAAQGAAQEEAALEGTAQESGSAQARSGASSWIQRSKQMQAAVTSLLPMPKPVGLQVGGSSGSASAVVPYPFGALAATAGVSEASGRRPTSNHITNFELNRLFATSTAPRLAAALYGGDGQAAAIAAIQLRHRMAQSGRGSEGIVRNWDAQGEANVVTVPHDLPTYTDVQKKRRADNVLAALPAEAMSAAMAGTSEACSICYEDLREGQAVRRLPCAHVFHSHCIAKWLHVRLTCPLDNLPVDESLEMLAASRGGEQPAEAEGGEDSEGDGAEAPAPPSAEPPPLPGAAEQHPSDALPPVGLGELRAAAENAGLSVEAVVDALARQRAGGGPEAQARAPLLVVE